jgi:hypothetical protein
VKKDGVNANTAEAAEKQPTRERQRRSHFGQLVGQFTCFSFCDQRHDEPRFPVNHRVVMSGGTPRAMKFTVTAEAAEIAE